MHKSTREKLRSGVNRDGMIAKILTAGVVAGALDFVFATSIWSIRGVPPVVIPQSVASGLLGAAAFKQGAASALLGTALHLSMTTLMAAVYAAAAPPAVRSRPLAAGPVYGAVIWLVMNKVVVPLSAAPIQAPPPAIALADLAAHMLLVGLPIALILRCARPAATGR